ncbi:MAG: methyltransferase family protein, partial [Actinocrinis sp.]
MHHTDDAHGGPRAAAQLPPFLRMMQMIAGFQVSQALQAAAELDLATILVDGPCTVQDLAAYTGAAPEAIDRIVGFLENLGVFRRTAKGVEVTDLGR